MMMMLHLLRALKLNQFLPVFEAIVKLCGMMMMIMMMMMMN